MTTALTVLILAILGGFLSRLCGRKSVIPFGLEQWLYALPYGLIFLGSLWGIPVYVLAVLGKRMGHGQYIHMGYLPKQDASMDEKLDFIVRFFMGVDRGGNYKRCAVGLAVTGLAVTLPAGLLYAVLVSPLAGLIIALSGATKALAYAIGWAAQDFVEHPTKIGEILTGVFGWGIIAMVLA